ncbi:MAG: cysteine--tRNA ligase [Anaerolineales bacterium]|uniref:Cysteine--tRNA ligase n=1 Tax=Candidatus Desulfolinea nitratireducens TaxID=2841698 RepID=A0A8J6TFJ7_9CHLR|nr:cysteine--tRNA ligase [Candidatus Desulfolinea nitratireducens]
MLRLYNTQSRKKEEFKTIEPDKVRMYVCGPTVYDNAHVGHAMSALVFDIIRRYLQYRGYDVKFAMNFTDVDDKIINRANAKGVDPFELAEGYIQDYKDHLNDLNILPATVNPRATEPKTMKQILAMIEGLIEIGYAYTAEGDVYFRVHKDDDYGKLSGRKLDEMQAGARIAVEDIKENAGDFALWKNAKEGEPAWDTPWGSGRPGWHIECSAMCLHELGESIDIHGGGNDLIFPHHENEIAQSESFTGKAFSRYWMHNGMLQLSGEKMSKSIGNLVTIKDFLVDHEGDVMRMLVLNGNYRSPLAFTDESIAAAENGIKRLKSAFRPATANATGTETEALTAKIEATQAAFTETMDDDFNTAGALGYLFELVRLVNSARDAGATDAQLQPAQETLRELTGVLGLELAEKEGSGDADKFIDLLVEVRSEVRTQKLWALSDQIRDKLKVLGVNIEDSKDGTSWRWE